METIQKKHYSIAKHVEGTLLCTVDLLIKDKKRLKRVSCSNFKFVYDVYAYASGQDTILHVLFCNVLLTYFSRYLFSVCFVLKDFFSSACIMIRDESFLYKLSLHVGH